MDALLNIDKLNISKLQQEFSKERINNFIINRDSLSENLDKHASFLFGNNCKNLSILDYILLKMETNRNDIVLTRKLKDLVRHIIQVDTIQFIFHNNF